MEEMFTLFWTTYPRKVAKGAARKAWGKAVEKAAPEVILAALEKQKGMGVFNVEPCYIPYPVTWLNQERWDDEVAPQLQGGRGTARNFHINNSKEEGYGF